MNIFEIQLSDRKVQFGFETLPEILSAEIVPMLDSDSNDTRLEGVVRAMMCGLRFVDGFDKIDQETVAQILRDPDLQIPITFACSVLTRVPWCGDFVRADGTRLPITLLKQDAETRQILMQDAAMVGNLVAVDVQTFH